MNFCHRSRPPSSISSVKMQSSVRATGELCLHLVHNFVRRLTRLMRIAAATLAPAKLRTSSQSDW